MQGLYVGQVDKTTAIRSGKAKQMYSYTGQDDTKILHDKIRCNTHDKMLSEQKKACRKGRDKTKTKQCMKHITEQFCEI